MLTCCVWRSPCWRHWSSRPRTWSPSSRGRRPPRGRRPTTSSSSPTTSCPPGRRSAALRLSQVTLSHFNNPDSISFIANPKRAQKMYSRNPSTTLYGLVQTFSKVKMKTSLSRHIWRPFVVWWATWCVTRYLSGSWDLTSLCSRLDRERWLLQDNCRSCLRHQHLHRNNRDFRSPGGRILQDLCLLQVTNSVALPIRGPRFW